MFEILADSLAQTRRQARFEPLHNPTEIDPFTLYRGYPSATVSPQHVVALNWSPDAAAIDLHDRLSWRQLYRRHPVPVAEVARAAETLASGPRSVEALAVAMKVPLIPKK